MKKRYINVEVIVYSCDYNVILASDYDPELDAYDNFGSVNDFL